MLLLWLLVRFHVVNVRGFMARTLPSSNRLQTSLVLPSASVDFFNQSLSGCGGLDWGGLDYGEFNSKGPKSYFCMSLAKFVFICLYLSGFVFILFFCLYLFLKGLF